MSQNTSSTSQIEQVDLKCSSLSDEGDSNISGSQGPSETIGKAVETKGRGSKEKRVEWVRFFVKLQIWQQNRHERLI